MTRQRRGLSLTAGLMADGARAPLSALDVSYGRILRLAWPASVAASITPLLGIIDVWALGRSARPLDIAAVGLAASIFSLAYWTFGFLRMSTAGLTAQAAGQGDVEEVRLGFLRALVCGATIGGVLIFLQWPIGRLAFSLLAIDSAASAATFASAQAYFAIRIWGAPFALATYACLGWLTARGYTDYLMGTALGMTAVNIVLNLWFVLGLGWGAAGIAAGTLIAEMAGFAIAFAFVVRVLRRGGPLRLTAPRAELLRADKLRRMLRINRDIFIRTLLLALSFVWFIQRGSAFGDVTLAANQVLLQLFLLSGLAIDGTAIAAEPLVGQSLGRAEVRNPGAREAAHADYRRVLRRGFVLAGLIAIGFCLVYALAGDRLLLLLIEPGPIFETARRFWPWVLISPLIVMLCFQLDGIFVGATRSREMRDSMILAALVFLPASLWLGGRFGNHGLWLAFFLYFLMRAGTLFVFLPRINRSFQGET